MLAGVGTLMIEPSHICMVYFIIPIAIDSAFKPGAGREVIDHQAWLCSWHFHYSLVSRKGKLLTHARH